MALEERYQANFGSREVGEPDDNDSSTKNLSCVLSSSPLVSSHT